MNFFSLPKNTRRTIVLSLVGFLCILCIWIILFISWSHQTGFKTASLFDRSHIIYIDENGEQIFGPYKLNDEWYYFDEDSGYMMTGLVNIGEDTFYYNESGIRQTGLKTINDQVYYFQADGTMLTSSFQKIEEDTDTFVAYFQEDGTMATGTVTLNGTDYCFDESGHLKLDLSVMQKEIQDILSLYDGNNSVYFENLETQQAFSLNSGEMYPCSIIKIFVMATVYDQIDKGNLDYDTCIPYLEAMIIDSDNTSYNILLNDLGQGDPIQGAKVVNKYCSDLQLNHTEIHHGLVPGDGYFTDGENNVTTPEDVAKLLEHLYDHDIVTADACDEMIDLLSRCADTSGLVSALPENVICAHKSGWTDAYYLDGGIIYAPYGDYILVVFSDSSYQMPCQDISDYVYNYLSGLYQI